jgi:hypothetical protein
MADLLCQEKVFGGLFFLLGLQHWGNNFGVAFSRVAGARAQGGRDGYYRGIHHQQTPTMESVDEMVQNMAEEGKTRASSGERVR